MTYRNAAWSDDAMFLGITCRSCGAQPSKSCRTVTGNLVACHVTRRHDVIWNEECRCGRCNRGPKPVDSQPQN